MKEREEVCTCGSVLTNKPLKLPPTGYLNGDDFLCAVTALFPVPPLQV